MFATELSARRRDEIHESVAVAGLENVTVVEAGEHETNLPPGCCDAVFLRRDETDSQVREGSTAGDL